MTMEERAVRARQIADEARELREAFRNVPAKQAVADELGHEVSEGEHREARMDYTTLCCSTQADGPLPYESVYAGEKRLLAGDSLDEVMLAYQLVDYQAPNDLAREPQDHLAIELDFLAYLYAKAVSDEAHEGELLDLADSFKESHVDSWVGTYVDEGNAVVEGDYYRAKLEQLRAFAGR